MTPGYWSGRRVLLTGHTGFKGAWLACWLTHLGAKVTGYSLPPEHDDGTYAALTPLDLAEEVTGDVLDAAALSAAFSSARPEVVLHLAAQPLVRRSFREPALTYATNVVGTANVLTAARETSSVTAVLVVTSDKVYADTSRPTGCVEGDALGGKDPYSASKACAELVVASWRASWPDAPPVATARAGNVVGGGDRGRDRLIPDVLRALDEDRPVRLRNPGATRPWQFVLEPLSGYLTYAERLALAPESVPPAVNFGPRLDEPPVPVAEVVETLLTLHGGGRWEDEVTPQPAEAQTLVLDPSLAERALGWRPRTTVRDALDRTLAWHLSQQRGEDMRAVTLRQISEFVEQESA